MRDTQPVSRPRRRRRTLVVALLIVLAAAAALVVVLVRRGRAGSRGALGPLPSITIREVGRHRTLIVGGVVLGDTGVASTSQAQLVAHLPLLFHPEPRDVLQIGFGTGETTRAICRHHIDRLDCVEPIFPLLEVPGQFSRGGPKVLDDRRVHIHVAQPRTFLRDDRRAYDVIVSCPPHPVLARNGSLYTVEFFRDCAARLEPGGIFSTRIPTRDIRFDDVAVILRSLRKAFPFVYVWQSPLGRNSELTVLALTHPTNPNAPIYAPYDALADRMGGPALSDSLDEPADLMDLYLLGPREVNALIAGSTQLNTDENEYIGTAAARAIETALPGVLPPPECTPDACPLKTAAPDAREGDTQAARRLSARTYARLLDARATGGVFLDLRELGDERGGRVVNRLAHRWWSSNRVFRGRLYELAGEPHRARAEWHRALRDDPTNEIARDLLGMTDRALDEAKALVDPAESSFRIGLYLLAHAKEAGSSDEKTARLEAAAAAFRHAIAWDPLRVRAYDLLVRTWFASSGLTDDPARLVDDPDSAGAWAALAESAQRAQLDGLAVDATTRALTIAPDRAAEFEKALASIEALRGNFREAAEHAERAGDQDLLKQIYSWREHPIRPAAQRVLDHTDGESSTAATVEEKASPDGEVP